MHGYAGGHEGRLEFSEDGRLLLKRTTVEEAHFYFWLQRLSHVEATAAPAAAATSPVDANAVGANDLHSANSICPLGCLADCPLLCLDRAFSMAATDVKGRDRDIRSAKQLRCWVPEAYEVVRAGRCQEEKHPVTLLLENLLFGLRNPVVIDIKMGTRLHGDNASPSKIERSTKYAIVRGADKLGISFSGLWGNEDGREVKWEGGSRQKQGGFRPTTFEAYVELFRAFLVSAGAPTQASRQLLQMLRDLREIWKEQGIVNLYGSSLLIVAGTGSIGKIVKVKMIDFAHTTLYPKKKDTGYLKGIDSLISAVEEAARTWGVGPGSGGCTELEALWRSRCTTE